MAKFLYQLAFSSVSSPTTAQVHIFLTQNRDVESWYAAFPGSYLFKSDRLLIELQRQFAQFFGQGHFIITYVSAGLIGGVLPEAIWQWTRQIDPPQITFGS